MKTKKKAKKKAKKKPLRRAGAKASLTKKKPKKKAAALKKKSAATKKKTKKKKTTTKAKLEPAHQKILDDAAVAYAALAQRAKDIWQRLEARGATARPAVSDDDESWGGIEYALDNHTLPDALEVSLLVHDGEGAAGGVVDGLRLLSLAEMVDIELHASRSAPPQKDVATMIEARKRHDKQWKMKARSDDERVARLGPALSFTFAVGKGGSCWLVDLDPVDFDDFGQVLEVASDGKIRWHAPDFLSWLESVV